MRNFLYQMLKIMNDLSAIRKGTVGKRIGRRITGRAAGKTIRRLFKYERRDHYLTCILQDYRKDKCGNCTKLCTHRVALHGLNGDGGRTLNANIPKEYRYVTLNNSPVRESQAKIYVLLDRYVQTFKRKDGDIKSLY